MGTEVYSWRVAADLKTGLEREARRRNLSVSKVLDLAAREWLKINSSEKDSDEEQRQLHRAAAKCLAVLASGDTHRSERVHQAVRERLRRRYER